MTPSTNAGYAATPSAAWHTLYVHVLLNKKGIAGRARKIRHLWDLRWHEENRAIAQGVSDLHQHHCLICRRGLGTQAHILCECPALAQIRLSNHIDFNKAVRRLPPGPERTLGQAIVHLLHFHQPLEERGQLWTGLWTAAHRHLIQGALAGCTLRAGRQILRDLSTRAATCVTHRWTLYQEALTDYAHRKAALTPPDVDVSPPVTPMSPSPSTLRSPRLRGPLGSRHTPYPKTTVPGTPLSTLHRPWDHPSTFTNECDSDDGRGQRPHTGRDRDPLPPTTTRHLQFLGLPHGGGPRLISPLPPSCPGGHTVEFGACVYRTARVGYCFNVPRACCHFSYVLDAQWIFVFYMQ